MVGERMSTIGTKRMPFALQMSDNDPKRTSSLGTSEPGCAPISLAAPSLSAKL